LEEEARRKQTDNITSNITFPFILLLNAGGHPFIRMIDEENKQIRWPFTALSVMLLFFSYKTIQKELQ